VRGLIGRWWRTPAVRRRVAVVVVVLGAVLAVVGVLSARWGLLVAGIVVLGLGASLGPARIRR
jgi:formate-dependent nitrite reductase membrane component NrfD